MFNNLFLLGAGICFIALIFSVVISNKIPHYIPTILLVTTLVLGLIGGYIHFFGKTCGNCGTRNYAFADRCMYCSHPFLTRCENCGTALQDGDTQCPLCGRPVDGQGRVNWGMGGQLPR